MALTWITPINVTKIAMALLPLGSEHSQEKYQPDAVGFLDQLYHALNDYRYPESPQQGIQSTHSIDRIEAALIRLLAEANTFIHLLTPHAQKALEEQFQINSVATVA